VNDDGLSDLTGNGDERCKCRALSVPWGVVVMVVEPDFADGGNLVLSPDLSQSILKGEIAALRIVRVKAHARREPAGKTRHQVQRELGRSHRIAGRRIGRGEPYDNQTHDARRSRPFDDLIRSFREVVRIEMAMSIGNGRRNHRGRA